MDSIAEEQSSSETGLLQGEFTSDGSLDMNGNPARKSSTGNWRACPYILVTECCERLAYFGIYTNLVTYLTNNLHQSNVSAATNVTTWAGTCYLTPLIGAILADARWGRYRTIAVFCTIYFIGLCILTLSASVPAFKPAACDESHCPSATPAQNGVFFIGLYLIALGTGGIKPCVSSFGADQFDDTDPIENVNKGSFFNWFYFSINVGAFVSTSFIIWIQDIAGWGIGFGIPALFMGIAIGSFFSGTQVYRFQRLGGNPVTRICQVLVASFRKRNVEVPADSSLLYEVPDESVTDGSKKLEHSDDLSILDKAAVVLEEESETGNFSNPWKICTVTQIEELKILIRIFPIWATSILFSAVYAQMSSTFVMQGTMMDTKLASFTIPPASLSIFDVVSVLICVPVYEKFIVPIARNYTGHERGFTQLQRIGIGLFISVFSMVASALTEIRRLRVAKDIGLTDQNIAVPITILWQIPQYFLIGAAEIFTFIGQVEFFYEQSPDSMRSLCNALALLTTSLGNYLSSFIVTIVAYFGWIPENILNQGHLDYFFWLLAGLSLVNLVVYIFCAKNYRPKNTTRVSLGSSRGGWSMRCE